MVQPEGEPTPETDGSEQSKHAGGGHGLLSRTDSTSTEDTGERANAETQKHHRVRLEPASHSVGTKADRARVKFPDQKNNLATTSKPRSTPTIQHAT